MKLCLLNSWEEQVKVLCDPLGPCVEKLDSTARDIVFAKIVEILASKEYIDFLLPWISDLASSVPPLDNDILSSLVECLILVSNDTQKDGPQIREVQNLYKTLSAKYNI
jgi:hypothetical protein